MASKKKKINSNIKIDKDIKKPKKTKDVLPFEKKTKVEKPHPEDFGVFEFGWEKKNQIEKPKKTDFKPKIFKWEKRSNIAKPKRSDFIFHRLNWKIHWLDNLLHPKENEVPQKEDFEEKKERNVIVGDSETIKASSLFEEEKENNFKKYESKEKVFDEPLEEKRDLHAGILLFIIGITYITFFGMILGRYVLVMATSDYLLLNSIFLDLTIISIIVAALYAIRKNIFYGFAYISIVVIVYIALSFLFAETLLSTITTLLIVLAVLPIETYLVMYVKK